MKFNELVDYVKSTRKVVDDQTAVKAMDLYEEWAYEKTEIDEAGNEVKAPVHYEVGERVRYLRSDGKMKLHKCRQAHDGQVDRTPEVESLWEVIDIEHAGTIEDPIPYDQNMVVYKDKYYIYNEILYLCVRNSGNPLYNTPDNLIDAGYFTIVE